MRYLLIILFLVTSAPLRAEYYNTSIFSREQRIQSWKSQRDKGIVKQKLDFSCGAASLATILQQHYALDINEAKLIDLIGLKDLFSFTDLAIISEELGFKGVAIALDFNMLKQLKIPAILYINYHDNEHFSVIRAANEHYVWLGDPSWGNIKMSSNKFRSYWETRDDKKSPGKILLIIPQNISEKKAKKTFFGVVNSTPSTFFITSPTERY